jgi:aspartate/methionine/tyrosine aminotransferase
MLINNR